MGLWVDEMVADYPPSPIRKTESVEVVQTEESWEPESRKPEWIRNPGIQIIIIPGWRIVSHNRWTFGVVIVIDYLRLPIILRLRFNRILPFVDFNRQALLRSKILDRLGRLIPVHPQFAGIQR
jgi:hypothetical protein